MCPEGTGGEVDLMSTVYGDWSVESKSVGVGYVEIRSVIGVVSSKRLE